MIAQRLAATHPASVLALVSAACPGTLPDAVRPAMAARGARAQQHGMAAIVDETLERWFSDGYRRQPACDRIRRRLLADDPHDWAACWAAIAALDHTAILRSITAPTLCLAGAADAASPPQAVAATAQAIAGATFQVLPDASHMFFLEQPEATARAITAFLSTTGAA
jgi:3-oxoadipate enol-lactonase